jgi:helicase MOV-10
MHRGVDRVVDTGMVATLFPSGRRELPTSNTFTLRDVDLFNKTIADNSEQKKAVEKILNVTHDLPYIVFGPPGTGKTVTIVEAILQIKNRTKKKILVCAPSNSACDMLAIKLLEKCKKEELIRIHSSTRERTTITAELKGYSNMDEDDDSFTKINEQILYSHRIVVSTLTLIGRFTNKYKPDCVFIDEAAQASEPETDIAIALVQPGKQVILAGDPEQLGPMTTKCAEKFGLGRSLLARLMENEVYSLDPQTRTYDPNFITMLKLNFRSHPDILHIPNLLFYDNLLEPKSTSAMRDPIVGTSIFPVILNINIRREGQAIEFYSVHSKERREGSSPSYFNPFEANVVVKYVTALMRLNLPSAYRVRMDQIGVVTPYKRQVHKIKDRLKHQGFEAVEVGTTESFQGREKRVIIISTVRAQHSLLLHDRKYNLGFVGHNQRFNVAVTRAISKLVVVGCPLVLARDDKWKMFMQLCEERGSYFGKPFDFDTDDFKNDVLNRMNKFKHKDDQYQ